LAIFVADDHEFSVVGVGEYDEVVGGWEMYILLIGC